MKKIVCGIILLLVILGIVIAIYMNHEKDRKQKEQNIETVLTKTVDVEGKEAKYELLKNKDDTIYGIEFQNPDLMTDITITKRGYKEEIKNSLEENMYKFKEDGVYKLEIKTVNGTRITTTTFKVVVQN